MRLYQWPLKNKSQTVSLIKTAVSRFHGDLKNFPELTKMNALEYYNFVKNIPYHLDPKSEEVVSRPLALLTMFPAMDCKKKSVLMGSYMMLLHGPDSFRYVLSSNRPDRKICHIFTQVLVDGNQWVNADATYPSNKFGQKKRVTNFEIVGG